MLLVTQRGSGIAGNAVELEKSLEVLRIDAGHERRE